MSRWKMITIEIIRPKEIPKEVWNEMKIKAAIEV
jgi:hypothetical protein